MSPQFPIAADSAASVVAELHQLSIDPAQTYRVRDLQLARGDIKIYLTEGILPSPNRSPVTLWPPSSPRPIPKRVTPKFSCLPPTRSERASLASFAKTPNLDEHFTSAVFFFSDETAKELRAQIEDHPLHPAPEQGKELAATADNVLRADANEIDVRMAQALLDNHQPRTAASFTALSAAAAWASSTSSMSRAALSPFFLATSRIQNKAFNFSGLVQFPPAPESSRRSIPLGAFPTTALIP